MTRRPLRWWALGAVAGACLSLSARVAFAQTPTPGAGQTVVVLPFSGQASEALRSDVEDAVHNALLARGARVPQRSEVLGAIGVAAPQDPGAIVLLARNMGGTHVVTGIVRPLAGQYNLSLTLYEVPSGRNARQEGNIGQDDAQASLGPLLEALFSPNALSAPAPDPEELRRQEEARQREEARRREEEARQREEARRRQEEEARRRQSQWERDHPLRRFDDGGPFSLGLRLGVGGLLVGTREVPAVPAGTPAPPAPTSTVFTLRADGTLALRALSGLELLGSLELMTSPTAAVGLGAGAQWNLPASSRSRFRASAGLVLGLWQGVTGARLTSVWIAPHARAEVTLLQGVAAYGGLELDLVPGSNGGLVSLVVGLGVRLRLGN
ncbi:MAG: hypothetical protein HY909_25680 [Deltaproteobacteria bacterium]|nr:hypothetical protein [Deltaproteobacteria bacterium]